MGWAMLGLILMAALSGEPAPGVPPAPRPSVITMPDWVAKPRAEDLTAFYPKAAARMSRSGQATIQCQVNVEGLLVGCAAISEQPAGEGFGDAAVGMAGKFKMRPMTRDGTAVAGGVIRIPIRFETPRSLPSLQVASRCYGFAAARAELQPSAPVAQMNFIGWRMLAEIRLASERLRPSALEERLRSLRATGASQLDSVQFKAERTACDAQFRGTEAEFEGMLKSIGG